MTDDYSIQLRHHIRTQGYELAEHLAEVLTPEIHAALEVGAAIEGIEIDKDVIAVAAKAAYYAMAADLLAEDGHWLLARILRREKRRIVEACQRAKR